MGWSSIRLGSVHSSSPAWSLWRRGWSAPWASSRVADEEASAVELPAGVTALAFRDIFPPTSFSTGAIVDYNSSGAYFRPHRSKSSSRRVAHGTRTSGVVAVRGHRCSESAAGGGRFSGPADLHTISVAVGAVG